MKEEVFFLKYAFPCSFILLDRKEITKEELDKLEKAVVNDEVLDREYLEKIYFRAFQKIEKFANELKKDKWGLEVLKKYFIEEHNCIINEGKYAYAKAPESLKNLCKVHKAKVLEIKDEVLIVEYDGNKKRPVMKLLVPGVVVNDIVTIHYGYAIEKL